MPRALDYTNHLFGPLKALMTDATPRASLARYWICQCVKCAAVRSIRVDKLSNTLNCTECGAHGVMGTGQSAKALKYKIVTYTGGTRPSAAGGMLRHSFAAMYDADGKLLAYTRPWWRQEDRRAPDMSIMIMASFAAERKVIEPQFTRTYPKWFGVEGIDSSEIYALGNDEDVNAEFERRVGIPAKGAQNKWVAVDVGQALV